TAKEIRLGREFVAGFAGAGERSAAVQPVNPLANVAGQAMNRRERNTGRGQPVSARKFLSDWAEYAHALLLTDETCFVN
ncbi:MAG: hypothetical protein HC834_08635, partial [Rhodospirillales bacterium]|nr:hypothetical protein [Rhodospirillales bacterium]